MVTAGAALVMWRGAARQPLAVRRILYPIAVGMALSAAADMIYSYYVLTGPSYPDLSLGDVGWLGSYVAMVFGVFRMLRGSKQRLDVDGLIDVAAVTVVVVLLEWQFSLAAVLSDSSHSLLSKTVLSSYPILDAVLVALVVRLAMNRSTRNVMSLLIGFGAACWLAADFAFMMSPSAVQYQSWMDAGWLVGAAVFAASAWHAHPPTTSALAHHEDNLGHGRIGVALVPLMVPSVIQLVHYWRGDQTNPWPMAAATAVLIGLAFARALRLMKSERAARERVRAQERYAQALAVNSSDAVIVIGADERIMSESAQLAALVGHPGISVLGVDALRLVLPADHDMLRSIFDRCLAAPGRVFQAELRVRHSEGREIWVACRMVNLLSDPDVGGVVVNIHDVTARKAAEEQLAHQAFHDSLTGLANRALFRDRVEQALLRNVRTGLMPAVIYLDLDGFKTVNDSLGHEAGDDLLREVARRLMAAVRAEDTVARLGGDEFAILIEQSDHPIEEATAVAERILQTLTAPMTLDDRRVTVSASLGIAPADTDSTASSLLRDADVAMYQGKANGKAKWVLYDGSMRAHAVERLELEYDLSGALEASQLRLVYQPVVHLETGRIVGFEALLRWDHPRLGTIDPEKFIPIAEANRLIIPIGQWVLDTACRTAAGWHRQFPRETPLSMAVNVSAIQLADSELVSHVAGALASSGLAPTSLVLEMTETVLIQDATATAKRLHELHALGVRLAIDDFGTGYSSLSYLRQFPVDILKIDQSFISTITEREQVPAIVRGLLDLGRTLQLETVAEGIEVDFQHASLREEDCELGQGFLFARPLPPDEAELLLMQLTNESASTRGLA